MGTTALLRRAPLAMLAALALLTFAGSAAAANATKLAKEQMSAGYQAAKRGYWQEALSRFQNANELNPGQPQILNNIAVALEATASYEEARATYERALKLAPSDDRLRRNFNLFKEFYESQIASDEQEGEGPDAGDATTEEPPEPPATDEVAGEEGDDDAGA